MTIIHLLNPSNDYIKSFQGTDNLISAQSVIQTFKSIENQRAYMKARNPSWLKLSRSQRTKAVLYLQIEKSVLPIQD